MAAPRPTLNKKRAQSADDATALPRVGPNRGQITTMYLFLALISLAVFSQTIRHNFVNFDDNLYVYDATAIKAGLTIKGIAVAFTTPHARNWHPLTTISHMMDCQLYGLNAGGHHATNLLLHTLAVLLLFRVLLQMTSSIWKSLLVAALFAVHPLHVESVAWVSERKDVLSAMFFFLMLSAYARYARTPSTGRYLLVVGLFGAGLMSKAMLVTAPVILLLLDYWPLRRTAPGKSKFGAWPRVFSGQSSTVSRLIFEKVPLLALSAGACVVTFVVQKRAVGVIPPLPLSWRVENAVVSYLIYVWQTLWPTRLAAFYPHPNDTLALWEVILATGLLLAITVTAIVFRNKRPYLFTGWLWYLLMLVPVIGLVQVGEQGHADRYTYLPHVGLFLLMVWGVADAIQARPSTWRVAAVTATLVVILALAAGTFIQTSYWRNSETLWTQALAVTSDNDFAHNNLGYLCIDSGRLDGAISHFEAAAMIRHDKTNMHYNVGSAVVEMNLANALALKGESDEAMVHYQQAIKLEPKYARAYYNRGNLLFAKGQIDDAITDWERTLQLQPDDADAHTCLGNALLRKASLNEAIAHYETALALAPEDPRSRNNLAWILATSSDAKIRDGRKAVEFAQQAVGISGGKEPQYLRTLAAAYAESGSFSESIAAAQQAAKIANMQGKPRLAKNLEKDLSLYRAYLPLRTNSFGD
jgi:tetratricopeptide (TPR) repeat protein